MDNDLTASAPPALSRVRPVPRGVHLIRRWPASADATAALGMFAAALAFYYPLVFLGRALVDYDAFVYFFPQRVYLARALQQGRLPLWDPDLFLGAPFLANPQTAVLYPPSWLFLLGPVQSIYSLQLVLHAFLAALFTYLLMRHAFGVAPLAGVVAALAYAFGGFAVGQVGHINQISAAAWLPAVLLAYARFEISHRPIWIAVGGLALASQLFAGHPQETYMTVIVLGLFGVVRAPWLSPRRLVLAGVAGVALCLLGGLIAGAQLLPTLELAPLSIRGDGVNWADAVAGSLPSYLSVRALFPPYWVSVPYTEYLGYVGVTPVALGLLALLFARSRGVVFGFLVVFLGLFLALGENNGWYARIFTTIPQFDTFRVPARWLLLWSFGAAVLGGLGADWVARGAIARLRDRWLWPRLALVVTILVCGLAWQRDEGEAFAQRRTPLAFGAITALTLAAAALPHLRARTLGLVILVGATGIELGAAAQTFPARQAPPAAYTQGESVDWLRANGVTNAERLISIARPEYAPASEGQVRAALSPLPGPLIDTVLVAQKWHDTLTPNVALQFGLNTADGYDGGVLPLLRWLHLTTILVSSPRPDGVLLTRMTAVPTDQQLDLLGVRYVIANGGTPGRDGLTSVDFGDLVLFRRVADVPRSLLVFGAHAAADESAALARMAQPDFNPTSEVVLEGAQTSTDPSGPGQGSSAVVPSLSQPERWRAHVSAPQASYLLQREAWYPGWRARVDGQDVPLLRADVVYRAVAVPAGEHDIEIWFESTSFAHGLMLSVAGLIVIIGVMAWTFFPSVPRRWQRGHR